MSADEKPPTPPVHWFRPFLSNAHLDLLATPIPPNTSDSNKWVALSDRESFACESIWQSLNETEQQAALQDTTPKDSEEDSNIKSKDTETEETHEDGVASITDVGVGIGKEKLFEVDVKRMRLIPIYWKYTGPPLKVRRVIWLHSESLPVADDLAEGLEKAYRVVQPWRAAYNDELDVARSIGVEGYDKLKQILNHNGQSQHVLFEDEYTARIFSHNPTSLISATLWSAFRKSPSVHPLPAGTYVFRGYVNAVQQALPGSSTRHGSPSTDDCEPDMVKEDRARHGRGRSLTTGMGDDAKEDVTDLILVVHGIGQGMAASWEAFNFLYATNQLRLIAQRQAAHPAVSSVMRSRRIQFLPVLWRANLKLDENEEQEMKDRQEAGLSNRFTLEDITLNNKIPFVRDVMNNVLIDVPYFMRRAEETVNHHRDRMIETVITQANLIYRLWCARNPGFDKQGRVHIIAHSLGSALAAHILSDQPTSNPPLSSMSEEQLRVTNRHLLFNTSALFMVGSPLGVFLHLHQAQLIARKGRDRTMNSPTDEAIDRKGIFGCLAVDSLYNIFNASDPIAYRLNPAVDSEYGSKLSPSAIPSINASTMSSISTRVTKLLGTTFASSPPKHGGYDSRSSSLPRTRTIGRSESVLELGTANERRPGTRGERRFDALNPHGTIDFYLPSTGNISDYLDMLTAHSSYWLDDTFAAFIISEICAKREDLMRTGLGPESHVVAEAILG